MTFAQHIFDFQELVWELNPGPLAPVYATIIPLDQRATHSMSNYKNITCISIIETQIVIFLQPCQPIANRL